MGQCALCHEEKVLIKSHIFPEFLYKPMYDQDHKYLIVSTNPSTPLKKRPKGIYEKLMCIECDNQIIGSYENYAAKVLFDDSSPSIETEKIKRGFIIHGLDYTKFKLYQISLLWRSSMARRTEVTNINLGPHSEIMRKMLLEGNPGEVHKYGVAMHFVPKYSNEMIGFISPPEPTPKKLEGHRWYRAFFNGLFWLYIVSNHSEMFTYPKVFLSKSGSLPITESGPAGERYIRKLASELTKGRKLL